MTSQKGRAVGGNIQDTLESGRNLIANCALFRGLEPQRRQALLTRVQLKKYAAGEQIFMMGDAGDSMMAVVSGAVRISVPSEKGKEVVLAIMYSGDFFGEIAMLDGRERSADAKAMTAASLAILQRRDVLSVLKDQPDASLSIIDMLCGRLRRTTRQMAEVTLLELPVRLARALLRMRTTQSMADGKEMVQVKLSQRELGNLVGATRESVNKCLREWQRHGVVRVDGTVITIRDCSSLEALSEAAEG